MDQTANKIAVLLGSDQESLIKSVLEEGFCTLTEVVNGSKIIGIKLTMPMLKDKSTMVYSVMVSVQKILEDLYKDDDPRDVMRVGIERWEGKDPVLENLSNEELLHAMIALDFGGVYKKERTYFEKGMQGGISPKLVRKRMARMAYKRKLISKKILRRRLK